MNSDRSRVVYPFRYTLGSRTYPSFGFSTVQFVKSFHHTIFVSVYDTISSVLTMSVMETDILPLLIILWTKCLLLRDLMTCSRSYFTRVSNLRHPICLLSCFLASIYMWHHFNTSQWSTYGNSYGAHYWTLTFSVRLLSAKFKY